MAVRMASLWHRGEGDGVSVVEVAIGSGRTPGRFRAEVVHSAAGEASAEVNPDAEMLLAGREQLQQTLLASGVVARQVLSAAERVMREAGQLFGSLLGAIR